MAQLEQQSRIAVLGLGYVGCVTAACLAASGHHVLGVDRDEHKVQLINNRQAPFYEPGLEDLVSDGVSTGRLSATTCLCEAVRDADVALICVGTPSERNGNINLDQLRRIVGQISETLPHRYKPLVVAVRSTVLPGTCDEYVIPALTGRGPQHVAVVFNPEFLREGNAIKDFFEPSLVVAGGTSSAAVEAVAGLYDFAEVPASRVSIRGAEMIKYACNAFHAAKISFANEIGSLAERLHICPGEVFEVLCKDDKLNISPAYLRPGFAFGGPCLPKDLRALQYRASRLDLQLLFLESILLSNQEHLRRAIDATLDLGAVRLGIVGLAFKENTDDLRESPVIALLEHLLGKGRDILIYDPHIQLDRIYGSNRDYILRVIPHIGKLLTSDFEKVAGWADQLVITHKPTPVLATTIASSGLPVLDLGHALQ